MRPSSSLRLSSYRFFQKRIIGPALIRGLRLRRGDKGGVPTIASLAPGLSRRTNQGEKGVPRVWFHAASAGELESLWSVISLWVERSQGECILTVFSPSAEGALRKLEAELGKSETCRVLFAGYCPWEGAWGDALKMLKPDLFVTAKYEAWPELWASLAQEGIPLAIVGARARRSLKVARDLSALLGSPLPKTELWTTHDEEMPLLREMLPDASIERMGDPRWDRVWARSAKGNPRASALIDRFKEAPRPWGILGSAWLEDLKAGADILLRTRGTVWLVPHDVSAPKIAQLEGWLTERGMSVLKTTELADTTGGKGETPNEPLAGGAEAKGGSNPPCLLVNEMGFLSELYAAADWAYVGGGFGAGVHSTIEPALQGIPVACGPGGATKFAEITELQRSGQLTMIPGDHGQRRNPWKAWSDQVFETSARARDQWREEARKRLGASRRIVERMEAIIGSRMDHEATPS